MDHFQLQHSSKQPIGAAMLTPRIRLRRMRLALPIALLLYRGEGSYRASAVRYRRPSGVLRGLTGPDVRADVGCVRRQR